MVIVLKKNFCIGLSILMMSFCVMGQDPHFSQFFIANNYVSPATLGTSVGNWKFTSNWRRQWNNAGTPFNTQAFSGEIKLIGKEKNESTLVTGGSLMLDQTMNGAFKSTYATASLAYHAALTKTEEGGSKLGIGLSGMYGNRTIDYSRLSFGEQFTSRGFDIYAPSGETTLAGSKSFFTIHSGLLYSFDNGTDFNMNVGASAYNIIKSKISFIGDPNEKLYTRYTFHMNSEYLISEATSILFNGLYNNQAIQSYFLVGGALGLNLNVFENRNKMLYLGGWYRQGDSFFPYVGMAVNHIQFGFSYDITSSQQNMGFQNPRSMEFSLVIRDVKGFVDGIPCPWK